MMVGSPAQVPALLSDGGASSGHTILRGQVPGGFYVALTSQQSSGGPYAKMQGKTS